MLTKHERQLEWWWYYRRYKDEIVAQNYSETSEETFAYDCRWIYTASAVSINRPVRPVGVARSTFHYPNKTRKPQTTLVQSWQNWEGDDLRRSSRILRRLRRSIDMRQQPPVRNTLVLLNIAAYIYQTVNTIYWIQQQYPAVWPRQALPIVWDTAVLGNSRPGPLTRAFVHNTFLSQRQPHRLLTAGFLHGSLLHLLLNLNALRSLPAWLETGLGAPLYLTTFLASIVAGNLADTIMSIDQHPATLCLGASGGICGLFGMMYVSLVRMGNHAAAWRVIKGMGMLFLFGLVSSNISNAGHVGGFVAGVVLTVLTGPSYSKSYALRRKNSLQVDIYSRDYRTAMGYDKRPSERGMVPLPLLWIAALVYLASESRFRAMPLLVWRGLRYPGSLL